MGFVLFIEIYLVGIFILCEDVFNYLMLEKI